LHNESHKLNNIIDWGAMSISYHLSVGTATSFRSHNR